MDREEILRDRLGEIMRRDAYGLVRPLWADLPEPLRERWRERADRLIERCRARGIIITIEESQI